MPSGSPKAQVSNCHFWNHGYTITNLKKYITTNKQILIGGAALIAAAAGGYFYTKR